MYVYLHYTIYTKVKVTPASDFFSGKLYIKIYKRSRLVYILWRILSYVKSSMSVYIYIYVYLFIHTHTHTYLYLYIDRQIVSKEDLKENEKKRKGRKKERKKRIERNSLLVILVSCKVFLHPYPVNCASIFPLIRSFDFLPCTDKVLTID
jgi:uncharacterized membrane protein